MGNSELFQSFLCAIKSDNISMCNGLVAVNFGYRISRLKLSTISQNLGKLTPDLLY